MAKNKGGGAGPSPGFATASISSFMYWQLPLGKHILFSVILKKAMFRINSYLAFFHFFCFTMTMLLP